jgi:hypothetical protein
MLPARKRLALALISGLALQAGAANSACAQAPATQDGTASGPAQQAGGTDVSTPAVATVPAQAAAPGSVAPDAAAPQKKTYLVPAGTKVLLQLRSALNSKSARPGDGVYFASTFPVVVGNRVMIPTGVYVQGVVDRVVRAGHVKGRAQLDMHFTSIIFPNGSVVEIPGLVNSLPGASKQSVKNDGEGTIEESPDKGRNASKTAEIAIPTGGTVGSISGIDSGHPLAGGLIGMGAGLAAAGIVTIFTRGADVNIESGTQVEMVLQRSLILEEKNLSETAGTEGAVSLVPAANQPKPLDKPARPHVVCPPGGLGCQ